MHGCLHLTVGERVERGEHAQLRSLLVTRFGKACDEWQGSIKGEEGSKRFRPGSEGNFPEEADVSPCVCVCFDANHSGTFLERGPCSTKDTCSCLSVIHYGIV